MALDVVRSEPRGAAVLISGAGVGGLTSALECWRNGFDVRIFERTKVNATSGDCVIIGPSAMSFLKNWPEMKARNEEIAYKPMRSFHKHTGERINGPIESPHLTFHMRPKLHAMLLEQAAKVGINVEYGREVMDYFEDQQQERAGIVFQDGSSLSADLVIAADGLQSKSWRLVAGKPVPARSSGSAVYRVAYPVEQALADPMVSDRFRLQPDGTSVLELWKGPGMYTVFWRSHDHMMMGLSRPDPGTSQESWHSTVSVEEVLKYTSTVPGWPEVADRVIKAVPGGKLVDYKLMWRDPQPKWTSNTGRIVQLGDAAHSFLPSSGSGATQAIEDSISLAACLAIAGKGHIPDATRVHNLLRFERVSFLQAMGIANRELRTNEKASSSAGSGITPGPWMFGHDPEKYARERYREAFDHLETGAHFENTNKPPRIKYQPWTIDGLVQAIENGEHTMLDEDWS